MTGAERSGEHFGGERLYKPEEERSRIPKRRDSSPITIVRAHNSAFLQHYEDFTYCNNSGVYDYELEDVKYENFR